MLAAWPYGHFWKVKKEVHINFNINLTNLFKADIETLL